MTLDELEKAFLKDAIPENEYAEICERSLRQYKALLADDTIAREFEGLEEFKAKWDVCLPFFPMARPAQKRNRKKTLSLHHGNLASSPPRNRTSPSWHAIHHNDSFIIRP